MSNLFWSLFTALGRALFSLRYSFDSKKLKAIEKERLKNDQGILFLANHTSYFDVFLTFFILWPKYRMRPLVVDYVLNYFFMRPLYRASRPVSMPDFEASVNSYKVEKAKQSMREIAEGLKRGENFLIYPSGQLKVSGKELLMGKSAAYELLKECPDANVVLIRTTGCWGSIFSKAVLGKSPPIFKTILQGAKILLKNGIFFTPRRKVIYEYEVNPKLLSKGSFSRIELNRLLENWFNRYPDEAGNISEIEPLRLISYSFWKNDVPEVAPPKQQKGGEIAVSEEVKAKVDQMIRKILEKPDLEVRQEMNLVYDLGLDSLNLSELAIMLSRSFEVGKIYPQDLETVETVLRAVSGRRQEPYKPLSDVTWPVDEARAHCQCVGDQTKTIPEAFLNACDRFKHFSACGDDLVGVIKYKKLRLAVLVLASFFRQYKEERLAIMLPASLGAYIAILAVQMAGKVPVMLNWTLGPKYLEEMMKISGAQRIISSSRFLDRVNHVDFGSCGDKIVPLEEIRKGLRFSSKLRAMFLSFRSPKAILKKLGLAGVDEKQPCVILFTSGTEAAPKGVPLSHKNILSGIRASFEKVDPSSHETIYSFLPPFHSFGFAITGLLPILCGIRVAFYPDPTDSFALAEGAQRWKVTFFVSAPSFVRGLFLVADPKNLKSITHFIMGAEKVPSEIQQKIKSLGKSVQLWEGYGITECSPVLSLNRSGNPSKGVGQLLSKVELITIHPETEKLLPKGSDGEICVRGPNVFDGYLKNPRSPFIEIEGKRWYRTGDLGHLDGEGNLILSGRLKRFVKMGGEMISLGAIEETLIQSLTSQNKIAPHIQSLAVVADEREEGKVRLILFTTFDLGREEASQILSTAGFSNLVKISSVKKVEEIPLMGTGKTNYRALQDLC